MEQPRHPAQGSATVRRWPVSLSDATFSTLHAALDVVVIAALAVVVSGLYHHLAYGSFGLEQALNYLGLGLLTALIFVPLRIAGGAYSVKSLLTEGRGAPALFHALGYAFLALLVIGFVAKGTQVYSRAAVALFFIASLGGLLLVRELFLHLAENGFRTGLLIGRPTLMIGTAEALRRFHARYQPEEVGLRVIDEVRLRADEMGKADQAMLAHHLKQVAARARTLGIAEVYVLSPWTEQALIERIVRQFLDLPVTVHLSGDRLLETFRDAQVQRIGPITSLELTRPPLSVWAHGLKRAFDNIGAGLGVVLLAPLFLMVGMAIKLDSPGPVFFRQQRRGFNGRTFRIWKFRTMSVTEENGGRQATRDDPRITRVGRFLRRYSIDELPQLFNVLMGEMSLVGPRPHAVDHDDEFTRQMRLYARRHKVLPGITGWAQVNGYRGLTDTEEKLRRRIELDLEYIERWSIWFDLYIILRTVFGAAAWRNAH